MRMRALVLALVSTCWPVAIVWAAVLGDPKKPWEDRPNDRPREHVQQIDRPRVSYAIEFRGTVDGLMTRTPVGYKPFRQGWQPNRSLTIQNVGDTDVVNPRIVINGKRNWHSLDSVVAEATPGCTTVAERARAIWEFRRRTRFHATTWDKECSDALKSLNVYGYTLCGDEARVLNDLWNAAGLLTRRGYPVGHVVTEVFYDGGYHLLDSDEHVFCLSRDNRTIASEADIVGDHDLVKRTHSYGINQAESRRTDEFSASLYGYEGKREGAYKTEARHSMDLVLRPGESLEFRWDHVGKQYTAGEPLRPGQAKRDGRGDLLAGWGPNAYDRLVNGRLCYRPDLSGEAARHGAETCDNARFDAASASIHAEDPGREAAITWRLACPYVLVGAKAAARIRGAANGSAEWRYSTDGKAWQTVTSNLEAGQDTLAVRLDDVLSPRKQPTYRFFLQLVLRGGAVAANVSFENDVQMAALALPELEVGTNRIEYTDDCPGARQVQITHCWTERTAWHPPEAPQGALSPRDGGVVEGSRVAFRWAAARDVDGERIADYHFELSEHADMRWPLSPNFERLISQAGSPEKNQWTVPYVGLLNADTTYYWHVRACDYSGVWGPWSRTFSFRLRAPDVPLDVKLTPRGDNALELQWRPNPQGSPPVAYNVYGSDERGFTTSDTDYMVFRGRGFVRNIEEYRAKPENAPDAGMLTTPANLIAQVAGTSLQVVGPDASLPNTNRAYYRVVAMDAAGNESGASDYAEVPRPFVFSRPETTARVGKPYRYQPQVIRSHGDLRCRRIEEGPYNAAYWDREEYGFSAVRLPKGLTMDATGVISGMPAEPGASEVSFKIDDQFGKSRVFSYRLIVAPGEDWEEATPQSQGVDSEKLKMEPKNL